MFRNDLKTKKLKYTAGWWWYAGIQGLNFKGVF